MSCTSFHSHRLLQLHAGTKFVVRGTVRKTCSCALLSAAEHAAVRIVGQSLGANDLVLAGGGARFDVFVPGGALLSLLVVESREVVSPPQMAIFEGTDGREKGLMKLAECIGRADSLNGRDVEAFASELQHAASTATSMRIDRSASTLSIAAVMTACRLFDKQLSTPITLSDLATRCGVAERTIEYGFRRVYDTTPMAFIKSQRLTRSRTALLRSAHASVSDTARAYGFTHMGQYSTDYRRLFGETPSMTRARASQGRA